MIWMTDAAGSLTFVRAEWEALTGQPQIQAQGFGWLEKVHPDDRETVRDLFLRANNEHDQFVMNYRLARTDGDFAWVVASASPSIWPETGEFLGFLGALSVIESSPDLVEACGYIGSIRPPSEVLDGVAPSTMEGLADQVLYARELAEQSNETTILGILDLALMEIGFRLAKNETVLQEPRVKPRLM